MNLPIPDINYALHEREGLKGTELVSLDSFRPAVVMDDDEEEWQFAESDDCTGY